MAEGQSFQIFGKNLNMQCFQPLAFRIYIDFITLLFQAGLVPLNHLSRIKDDWDQVATELGEVARIWGQVYKQMYVMRDF